MAAVETYKCDRCGDPFEARTADRKRGWARFCSKQCKAIRQEQQTGQYREFCENGGNGGGSSFINGWDSHKEDI